MLTSLRRGFPQYYRTDGPLDQEYNRAPDVHGRSKARFWSTAGAETLSSAIYRMFKTPQKWLAASSKCKWTYYMLPTSLLRGLARLPKPNQLSSASSNTSP